MYELSFNRLETQFKTIMRRYGMTRMERKTQRQIGGSNMILLRVVCSTVRSPPLLSCDVTETFEPVFWLSHEYVYFGVYLYLL